MPIAARLICLTILFCMQTGCAFGDRTVALDYRPVVEDVHAAGEMRVIPFVDTRPDKARVGEVRNGFGMVTADVRIKNDAGRWVTDALLAELRGCGIDATAVTSEDAGPAEYLVTGKLTEFHTSMYMRYKTRIKLELSVTRGGASILAREYTGRANKLAVTASAGEYQDVMRAALQDAMRQMAPDLAEALAGGTG